MNMCHVSRHKKERSLTQVPSHFLAFLMAGWMMTRESFNSVCKYRWNCAAIDP